MLPAASHEQRQLAASERSGGEKTVQECIGLGFICLQQSNRCSEDAAMVSTVRGR